MCEGQGGSTQSVGERGVWVPEGLTGDEIMAGAQALTRLFAVEHYEARSMARAVLTAVRRLGPPQTP